MKTAFIARFAQIAKDKNESFDAGALFDSPSMTDSLERQQASALAGHWLQKLETRNGRTVVCGLIPYWPAKEPNAEIRNGWAVCSFGEYRMRIKLHPNPTDTSGVGYPLDWNKKPELKRNGVRVPLDLMPPVWLQNPHQDGYDFIETNSIHWQTGLTYYSEKAKSYSIRLARSGRVDGCREKAQEKAQLKGLPFLNDVQLFQVAENCWELEADRKIEQANRLDCPRISHAHIALKTFFGLDTDLDW